MREIDRLVGNPWSFTSFPTKATGKVPEFRRHQSPLLSSIGFSLTLRRIRIVAMGIAFPNTTVSAMYQKLRALVASDLAPVVNSFPLRTVNRGGSLATGAPHGPSSVMGNDMLIAFFHHNLLILNKIFQVATLQCNVDESCALIYNIGIKQKRVNHKPERNHMFGDRLKLARKKTGYSLRSLSDALGGEVSAQAIGKYERGEMMPSSGVLIHLAKSLGVSLEYLLSDQVEELEELEFRKLSSTSAGDRARVEAEVIDRLQRYLAVEEILELDSGEWKPPLGGNRFLGQEEESEGLAEELRHEWNLGIDPIPNMTSLLEDRGIKVLVMSLPGRVSGLTCLVQRPKHKTKVPVIVVNKNVTLERRRFTLAHELGHRLIDESSTVDHEKASNVFAGAFLVPSEHLVPEIGKHRKAFGYKELVQLKRMYRVSAATLLVRLMQIGIIDESTLAYAFQTFARGWRKIEPEPLEIKGEEGEHEVPRRFERLCYWALAEGLISASKAGELLQQPLAEIEKGMRGPAEGDADSG